MRQKRFLVMLATIILLSGCLYGPVSNGTSVDHLGVEIWGNTSCVDPGQVVTLQAKVINHGAERRVIELTNHPVLDLCVNAPGYRKCWSDGKPLTQELTRLDLKPGESKTIEQKWVAEAGTFGANVFLWTEFHKLNDPARAGISVGGRPECPGQMR